MSAAAKLSEETQQEIAQVIAEFPFTKVHKAMKAVDWSWHDKGVPSVEALMQGAKDLLERLGDESWISTGGFIVGRYWDSCEERYRLGLGFVLETSDFEFRLRPYPHEEMKNMYDTAKRLRECLLNWQASTVEPADAGQTLEETAWLDEEEDAA